MTRLVPELWLTYYSHHNVLSADQLLYCRPLTGHSCNADVLFNDTDPEQITYDNNSRPSARIPAFKNNVDITTYDNSGGIQNYIHPRVSIKFHCFKRCVQIIVN
jgi:hypothetical protein